MEFIDPRLLSYSEAHSTPETPLLRQLNRDTHANVLKPRMLSGHLQGRFLAMVSRMVRPTTILEIGTYTGYSAICLAEGLPPHGRLITIEKNEELEERLRRTFTDAGLTSKIDLRIGNALKILPELEGPFDLVFIDADKENYSNYFDLVVDRVRPGGFILGDNVLWSGKVLDDKPDKDTKAILSFNDRVQHDSRVENVLLPIRDGIMVMRRL